MSEQLKKVKQLVELRQKARLGGGEKAISICFSASRPITV